MASVDASAITAYRDWITREVRTAGQGSCTGWTLRMQAAFPELMRVWGLVVRTDLPTRGMAMMAGHWWLVTPDGQIVDPTAQQFPWPFVYVPLPVAQWPSGAVVLQDAP